MMSVIATLKDIWFSLKGRSRFLFILSLALFATVTASRIAAPIVFSWIVVQAQNLSKGLILGACIYAILFFITRFLEECRFALYVSFEQEVQKLLSLRTIEIFFQIPFSSSRSKSPSENAIAVDRGLSGLRAVLYNSIFMLAPICVEAIVLLFIIAYRINWIMALWAFFILGIFLLVTTYFSQQIRELQEKWFATASANYKILSESLRSYETIRSFDQTNWVSTRYHIAADGFISEVIASLKPGIVLSVIQGTLLAILVGSMIGIVVISTPSGAEKIATLVLVNGLLLQIISPLLQFSGAYRLFIQGIASARQLLDLLKSEIVPTKIQHQPLYEKGEFQVVGLSVIYGETAILNIDHLTIPTYRLIVVSGASGSGKSTLARCLAGLCEYEGTLYSRRPSERIFYMTQDVHVFDLSIEENITLGLPIDNRKMQWALTRAGLSQDELRLLSNRGVGEGGTNVSGGQRQRIGLARMLYHDAEVMIFDEPTSALDAENARCVLDTLRELAREKTCIIVTHDQRCIEAADLNVKMVNGQWSSY